MTLRIRRTGRDLESVFRRLFGLHAGRVPEYIDVSLMHSLRVVILQFIPIFNPPSGC